MIRMDIKKLLETLSVVEDRGNPAEKPVLGHLHELIVLSTVRDETPKITEVDFEAFTLVDLEEYYKTTMNGVENTYLKIDQLVNDITGIKALQATKIDYF